MASKIVYGASLIDSISLVESGGKNATVGDYGAARGAWQMHKEAWDDSCVRLGKKWDFQQATNGAIGRVVATEHLRYLQARFERLSHRKPTSVDSYALWNLGVAGYQRRGWQISKCPIITQRAAAKVAKNTNIK